MHYSALIVCLALLSVNLGGCTGERSLSPAERLASDKRRIARQESVCEELRELGAQCDGHFEKPPHVEILLGKQWRGGNSSIELLTQLDRVDELTVIGGAADDTLFRRIGSLPGLSTVRIQQATLSPQCVDELLNVANLTGLDLDHVDLTDTDLTRICQMNLIWLSVTSTHELFPTEPPQSSPMRRLLSLRLSGTGISDRTVARFSRCDTIRALALDHANVTGSCMADISRLSRLTYLNLAFTAVDGLALRQLRELQHLQQLVLDHTPCTTVSLKEVSLLPALESLSLDQTPTTDEAVGWLVSMPNLRTISVSGTDTTVESLKSLSKIQTLLTAIDCNGDIVLFQPQWLNSEQGRWLPRWAASRNKSLFLWTDQGLQPLELPGVPQTQRQSGG